MLFGYKKQLVIINFIWNNKGKSKSFGFERVLKAFLVISKFFFLAFHVSVISGHLNKDLKNSAVEFYVFLKLVISFCILTFGLYNYWILPNDKSFFFYWIIFMTSETLLYPATSILCKDFIPPPTSIFRNIIFLFLDYIMVVLDFATLYLISNSLCNSQGFQISEPLDAAYFSFITAVTIGYGDITAQTPIGKFLVISQSITFLLYAVLFLNYYTSKIK